MKTINLKQTRASSKDLALSPDERTLLFREVKTPEHRMILILGTMAGLRADEICQCRFEWLEWDTINNKKVLNINIPLEARDTRNKYKLWKVKSRRERTTIIFDNELANELYFWYMNNRDGLLMSRQNVTTRIIKGKLAKVLDRTKPLTTHALRSTYQNYLKYELNLEPKFIAVMLGHKDIRTTLKHYDTMNKESAKAYLIGVMKE